MSVKIIKHPGGIYTLYSERKVTTTIDKAWDFFSQPKNLNKLTPADLNFKINSGSSSNFYEGKIITYTIKLLSIFKFNWTTEITTVEKKCFFIDKQLFGPYKLWHHEHHFKKNSDGTITIIDKVKYKLPFYILGAFIHKLFIRRKLLKIFMFRQQRINELFN